MPFIFCLPELKLQLTASSLGQALAWDTSTICTQGLNLFPEAMGGKIPNFTLLAFNSVQSLVIIVKIQTMLSILSSWISSNIN